MKPLRIVLVMPDPPLPFGQAMGRWFYVLLRGLVERGHSVTALVSCNPGPDAEKVRELFPPPRFDVRCFERPARSGLKAKWETLRRPYSFPFSDAMRAALEGELAKGYDLLHLEVTWTGWLGMAHPERAVLTVPFLYKLDFADQPDGSVREWGMRRLTYRAERELLRGFPSIIAVSPRLAEAVRTISPKAEVWAIPFGMEPTLYPYAGEPTEARPPTAGLVASFNWTPGLTAGHRLLGKLWPEIKRQVPDARLILAGTGARHAFREHRELPDVRIDDHVSDVPSFFRSIDLLLYPPNRSSGMKFKTLESFAFGVPVVTNAAGIEGIPAVDGVHAGICEDDAGMIDRAVAVLRDTALRDRQRLAARALFEAHCSPGPVLDQVERVYESTVRRAGIPLQGMAQPERQYS